MNENGTPIQDQQPEAPEAGAAGAPEGAPPAEPTTDEVGKMYDELGIKAPKPTGATKGRPKSTKVRAEDVSDKDADDTKYGRKNEAKGSEDKSKDAPDTDKDGDSGDDSDSKSKKVGKDSAEVSGESEKADDGVREDKPKSEGDSERGSEEDSDGRDDGTSEDESGKRPGKSNPKIEQRFQRLTEEKRAAEERAAELERQLQEKEQAVAQAKISQEDPEYTIDDFRKVRDEDGNILDLDENEAELAWRRWQDGYNQRAEERNAEMNRQAAQQQEQEQRAEQIMRSSVEAYDHLAGLMDDFPELVGSSDQYDAAFAAKAMPIIQKAIVYAPGTEPGNPEGNPPTIAGLRVDPKDILEAMRGFRNERRTLPLNGLDDNIESRSNVNVPHRRSSDPTINAANELYKGLGIDKRF